MSRLCCSLIVTVKATGCHLSSNSLYCYIILTYLVPLEVIVILRLTHLPPFPEYTMELWRFPRGYGPVRPVSMEGLVISMTRVTKYTQGARFLCQNDDCPCSTGKNFATSLPNLQLSHTHLGWQMRVIFMQVFTVCEHFRLVLFLGFHHIRVHTPGATESATVGNNLSCTMCSSPLKEDVKFRVLGGELGVYILSEVQWNVIQKENSSADKQLVELVHVEALDALKGQKQSALRYQSVTLFLRGRSTSYGFSYLSLQFVLCCIKNLFENVVICGNMKTWPLAVWKRCQ